MERLATLIPGFSCDLGRGDCEILKEVSQFNSIVQLIRRKFKVKNYGIKSRKSFPWEALSVLGHGGAVDPTSPNYVHLKIRGRKLLNHSISACTPEAGGEGEIPAGDRPRHGLPEGAMDGVRARTATHTARADHRAGEGESPITLRGSPDGYEGTRRRAKAQNLRSRDAFSWLMLPVDGNAKFIAAVGDFEVIVMSHRN